MNVSNALPATPRTDAAPRQKNESTPSFDKVMDLARSSAAPHSPRPGTPAPKPAAGNERPASAGPEKPRPGSRDEAPAPKDSTVQDQSRPAATSEAKRSADTAATDETAPEATSAPAPATREQADTAVDAPLPLPVLAQPAPLPTSPAAQQIALITQALGLTAGADAAAPAPAPALAGPTTTSPAPAAAVTAAVEPTTTAKLAAELASVANAAAGDDAVPDFQRAPAPTQPAASGATPAAVAAPIHAPAPALINAPALPAAPIATSPHQPGFASEFGDRVMLMAHGQVKSAQIALNPGELGPVDVRLELRGQEANLVLSALHPGTRAALEDALPRLREMFAAQGLALADAQVDSGSRDGSQQAGEGQRRSGDGAPSGLADGASATPAAVQRPRGLVDTFA